MRWSEFAEFLCREDFSGCQILSLQTCGSLNTRDDAPVRGAERCNRSGKLTRNPRIGQKLYFSATEDPRFVLVELLTPNVFAVSPKGQARRFEKTDRVERLNGVLKKDSGADVIIRYSLLFMDPVE